MTIKIKVDDAFEHKMVERIDKLVQALNIKRQWDQERIAKQAFDNARAQRQDIIKYQNMISYAAFLVWVISLAIVITKCPSVLLSVGTGMIATGFIMLAKDLAKINIFEAFLSGFIAQAYIDYADKNNMPS